jgi:hypothetical protein
VVLYPASCSAGQRLGGASLTRQIKLGGFGSLSSRISVVSTSVSTTGATASFRTTSFTGVRLGLAFATVRFAALATLRGLPRLAEFALRSLARLCTFNPFLRLAMIAPFCRCFRNALMPESRQPHNRVINRSCCERTLLAVALGSNNHQLTSTPSPSYPDSEMVDDDDEIQSEDEIHSHLTNGGPSHFQMDEAFCAVCVGQ